MTADRLRVWPGVDAEYYAYYLAGLGEAFGPTSLRFSAADFPELSQRHLLFVDAATGLRVCIDAFDDPSLSQPALAWCDVYGKVNRLADAVPADARSKVVALGPSFPIRLWAPPAAFWRAGETWLRARRRSWSSAQHVAPWRRQYRYRAPLSAYVPGVVREDYVFFAASLWREAPECNRHRLNFVRACRAARGLELDGGFAPFRHGYEAAIEAVEGHLAPSRYAAREWIERTRASLVAFVAPGVHDCLTWRFAESLALGKAIIAIPPARELPAPLLHGVHAHFVRPTEAAVGEALEQIRRQPEYRACLEKNARRYYLDELQPRRTIERLYARAGASLR